MHVLVVCLLLVSVTVSAASDLILGDENERVCSLRRSPEYCALPPLDQLAEPVVQEKPFAFYKNARGFCQLEGYEVTGPLYAKGFNYEGFLGYNMSRWHKVKFHTFSNNNVTFMINLKAASTSTRIFLSKVGKQVGSVFRASFDAEVHRQLSISGQEQRSFVDWFFAPERHGRKHIFSVIREPYSRLDSATGMVLSGYVASERRKEVVADTYRDGVWRSTHEHLYPQAYFLSHSRNITIFSLTEQLESKLKSWLGEVYPGESFSHPFLHHHKRNFGQYDDAMVQYLIDTGNHQFLRDYISDDRLWEIAQQLEC